MYLYKYTVFLCNLMSAVYLAVIHWYMGATARRMFEDEKAAILQQIDAECEKYKGQALPIPFRGVKAR